MFHITEWGFRAMEAEKPEGPWHYVKHNFREMNGQWAPNVFTDDDGTHYMIASNWIQRLTPDALSFAGDRIPVVQGKVLENPSLIKKDGFYYWFESQNGTCTLGNQPDKGKIDVWRAPNVTGPYEGPHDLIGANDRFQSPNTGTAVLGPDNRWWFAYNVYDMLRLTMCRQMHLDLLEWDETGWPTVNKGNGPGLTYRKPIDTEHPTWFPDLNDEFSQPELEGITAGILGRKWLFKRELPGAWSLRQHPGWLRLMTMYPSIQDVNCANLICQRPTSAYYSISTHMVFHPRQGWQQAGIIVRELNTTSTIAIGLDMNPVMRLKVWQNDGTGLKEIAWKNFFTKPDFIPESEVYLKIDVEGLVAQCSFSEDNVTWTRLGPDFVIPWQEGYFTAFHPGLFAGETVETHAPGYADFDYFHMENYERLPTR
jgi:beta-xylosidase